MNPALNDPGNTLVIFLFLAQQLGFLKQLLWLFPMPLSSVHLCLAEHGYKYTFLFEKWWWRHGSYCGFSSLGSTTMVSSVIYLSVFWHAVRKHIWIWSRHQGEAVGSHRLWSHVLSLLLRQQIYQCHCSKIIYHNYNVKTKVIMQLCNSYK